MDKIRGVNLGGWFVLERWMTKELFEENNVTGKDETKFNEQVTNKEEILNNHYETFITKDDLVWIKETGLNLVRIPVPWWLYGEGGYHKSIDYIDRALQWCDDLELPFMLDLHTAPGCQNGFDNGGIEGVLDWPHKKEYIDKTIEVLVRITTRYQKHKMFHSICVLNEPFLTIDKKIIDKFYIDSYNALRKVSKDLIIFFHDSFRLEHWEQFFKENTFHNVVLDTHLYQCFTEASGRLSLEEHLKAAHSRKQRLEKVSKFVDVIVGEWSLGLRRNESINDDTIIDAMTQYAQAQITSMRECKGHTFWSYKVSDKMGGWHLRSLIENKIINLEELLK